MHTDDVPSRSTSGRPGTLAGSFCHMTLEMLLFFFFIPIFFFSSRCPFTDKLCHNGWIWDSDKCECVVDVQHPNRREGKDEITKAFCLLSPGCLCFIFVLSHFFHWKNYSFDSILLDRLGLWYSNSPENKYSYVLISISCFLLGCFTLSLLANWSGNRKVLTSVSEVGPWDKFLF